MSLIPIHVQDWFLKTIPGILILGAAGSIFGAFTIFLTRKISKLLFVKKDLFLLFVLLPYGRRVDKGQKIRDLYLPLDNQTQFLLHFVHSTAYFVLNSLNLFFAMAISGYLYSLYTLTRPKMLSLAAAYLVYAIHCWLKTGAYLAALTPRSLDKNVEAVEKAKSKTYREWTENLQSDKA